MINFTELLAGKTSVSGALRAANKSLKTRLSVSCSRSSPLVVFNLTRRCNLNCQHCYLESENKTYTKELSFPEVKRAINSFEKLKIPVLLLSGGEPLVHKDIYRIIECVKSRNIRVGLSTNGTLISNAVAKKLKASGVDYVGISIDGQEKFHDAFRNLNGAYNKAVRGIRNAQDLGLKTGVRFTITQINISQLPMVLEMCVQEKIQRFCVYHLVYTGRGESLQTYDIDNKTRRKTVNFLIKRTRELIADSNNIEILSVDNHADGIYIYNYLKKRSLKKAKTALEILKSRGGCSAGDKIVDISPKGDIFACQFWKNNSLGNIRENDLGTIWLDREKKMFCKLREKSKHLKGKCGRCAYKLYCGGCRIRAYMVYNDYWQEDPCCYLKEEEIKG